MPKRPDRRDVNTTNDTTNDNDIVFVFEIERVGRFEDEDDVDVVVVSGVVGAMDG